MEHDNHGRRPQWNIGEAARASGVSAKMIRHYEAIGLLPPARRTEAGYRLYGEQDVRLLQFIHRGRALGFSLEQVANLLALWQDKDRASADVRRLAAAHIDELERKIAELEAMKRTLQALAHSCHGDQRSDCPILDDLASHDSCSNG
ncbi:Cu(I)-responsive transcriptional regulator [Massilia phyllosphaerae]|uniref:Cu(I)-responsive transcriptional regulator n=1 Tax=Massilia phyllosphaerae TaxID=3106034 RepID=UPI002B1CD8BD|nr:Cu(I)-responsive transcriptional regulator [Massilia sp. SGZ-792]